MPQDVPQARNETPPPPPSPLPVEPSPQALRPSGAADVAGRGGAGTGCGGVPGDTARSVPESPESPGTVPETLEHSQQEEWKARFRESAAQVPSERESDRRGVG